MMKLKEYKRKRNLKQTPEPPALTRSSSDIMHFCVQKHAARRLHYDFRLEYRGVLLSWAVPKGLSLNPKDKRLAIQVEDHPLDYQYFEGVIPKGNYGAGTVEIWDRGIYKVPQEDSRKNIEKYLTEGLKRGHFSVILDGDKLRGEFVFQKLKKSEKDNSWLIIKKGDSDSQNLIENPEKVKSKKSKEKMPEFIPPMLATLVDKPFDDPDWIFEVKWDGFRTLAFINRGKVQLKSRTEHILNVQFPSIVKELEKIPSQIIFDGELVILDSEGKSQFQLMQNYQQNRTGNLFYYIFDLLYKDGVDLRNTPLIERKEILKKYLSGIALSQVRFSDHILKDGSLFFKKAKDAKLEGIIGKNLASTYQSKRSRDWVKIKAVSRQEFVIGGFTAPRGTRKKFGALLVGVYNEKKDLIYSGHVGGGFTNELLKTVYDLLKPLVQTKCPFKTHPKTNSAVTWVQPKMVCEVSFSEWTKDNNLRQPIFKGLRFDKPPKKIVKEVTQAIPTVKLAEKVSSKKFHKLSLTNLDKIYWPEEKITKKDLLDYYEGISSFILPYLRHRPIMLHRYPNGIEGKDFYQKDLQENQLDGMKTYDVQHEGKIIHYMQINDLHSLLFAINLGSIDLHPFISRYENLENPDYCVIDIDPHEVPFKKAVETALIVHNLLDKIEVKNYCKTSGGNGLHILIPFHGKYDYTQSRQFAEIICSCAHKKIPDFTSLERAPGRRQKKIYLDYLQNRKGQTIVAPYSARPRPHATVSTPLLWDEVNDNLNPTQFTINTVPKRLKEQYSDEYFKDVLGKGIDLKKALKNLKKFMS